MTSTDRRSFLTLGAAGTAGLAVAGLAGCSGSDEPQPTTSPSSAGDESSAAPARGGSPLAREVLADKPLLYLDFQDDSDAKAPADRSGHGRRTVLHGTKWWPNDALGTAAPAGVGRAFYSGFSGDEAWIELPQGQQILADAPKTGLSVEMWICQEDPNFNQTVLALSSDQDPTGWSFGLQREGKGLIAEGPGYASATMTTASIPKAWHHLVWTLTPQGRVTGFVDGKQVGTGEVGAFKGSVTGATIGTKDGKGASLSGLWSQLAVYSGALAPERVAAHHAAGTTSNLPTTRGVDTWFGGPAYYKAFTNAEVLADAKRFPIAGWWMNGTAEELKKERQYLDGAVVVDPKVTPQALQQSGMWTIRTSGMDMSGTPGAETVGWLPEDEPDMDSVKMKKMDAELEDHPKGYLAYVNYGTGVTISTIDRYRVRPLVDREDIHQVSADLYSYCVHPKMREDVEKGLGIPADKVRRAALHGLVVERCRAFLTEPRPVWGVVGIGHPNPVTKEQEGWGSVPSADEVEGAMMSCVTSGASGILLFPQNFADDKPAPVWEAGKTYQAGDTVRDVKEQYRFWYARTTPKPGVDPTTVTDDSWLSWRPNPFGVRDEGHYARGVSQRIKAVHERLQKHAPALNSRSRQGGFNPDLTTRFWPEAPDGYAYLMAMQKMGHDEGSYEFVAPEGVSISEVEVVDSDRRIKAADDRFTDSFEHEWEHRFYRWKV